jgi:hypothetical protein
MEYLKTVRAKNPKTPLLTHGKEYDVIRASINRGYYLKNDIGKFSYYSRSNFEK